MEIAEASVHVNGARRNNGEENIVAKEDCGGCLGVEGQVPSQRRRRPAGATGSDGMYSSSPLFGKLIFNLSFLPQDDKTPSPHYAASMRQTSYVKKAERGQRRVGGEIGETDKKGE